MHLREYGVWLSKNAHVMSLLSDMEKAYSYSPKELWNTCIAHPLRLLRVQTPLLVAIDHIGVISSKLFCWKESTIDQMACRRR